MQSAGARLAIVGAAVVAVIVLFVVLSGGDDDDGSEPSVPTIVVKDGQPVGGVQTLTFTEGDDIRFVVESDVSDEVHFHGYDVGKDVEAGGQVEFDVPASISGEFEVELERRVVPIAEISVNPS
ncbi:MAG TPA: hypothetical protein VK326_09840 [Solirubrobacterales bacterium]|nr:hypothetical protein [Solirubrobacterales bacterium]